MRFPALIKRNLETYFSIYFLIILIAFVLIQYFRTFGYFVDDGFIMMRYAQNILNGHGWVFNHGEYYNAATSVLQVVLYVIQGKLFGVENLELIAYTDFYIWLAALGSAIYFYFKPYNKYIAAFIAFSVLLTPHFYRTFGIETVMSMSLLFFSLIAYQKKAYSFLYAMLSLLILTRLEFGLFTALMFMTLYLRDKIELSSLVKNGLLLSVPFIIWFICSYLYFGHIFPETLSSKMWQGDSGDWGSWPVFIKDMFRYISLLTLPWVLLFSVKMPTWKLAPKEYISLLNQNAFFFISLCFNAFFIYIGFKEGLKEKKLRGITIFATWTVIHAIIYGLILNVPGYPWYHSMMMILVIALTFIGIQEWKFKSNHRKVACLLVFFVPYIIIGCMNTDATIKDVRTVPYRNLATWIQENTNENSVIIHEEVGEIAFLTDRKTIDTVALTNPQYLPLLERKQRGIFWMQLFEPEVDYYFVSYHDHYPSPYVIDAFQSMLVYDAKDAIGIKLFKINPNKFSKATEDQISILDLEYTLQGPGDRAGHGVITTDENQMICPSIALHAQTETEAQTSFEITEFPESIAISSFDFTSAYPVKAVENGTDGALMRVAIKYKDGTQNEDILEHRISGAEQRSKFFTVNIDESKLLSSLSLSPYDTSNAFDWLHICNPVLNIK